jgi:hypothetical protein
MKRIALTTLLALTATTLPGGAKVFNPDKEEAARISELWALREATPSRYARHATVSQQKERRALRRAHPHGF